MSLGALLGASSRPLVCAHRGASADLPENTLVAVAAALDAGVRAVEVDVHLSADGVPVVIHDATLERTTDGSGAVASLTAERLGALDATAWRGVRVAREGVPALAAVLRLCRGRALLLVELKTDIADSPDSAALVAAAIRDAGMEEATALLAFDHRHLAAARDAAPWLERVALLSEPPGDVGAVIAGATAAAIGPLWSIVDAALAATAHAAGAAVLAWTVDDVAVARRLAATGVDAVISNRPAALAAELAAGRRGGAAQRSGGPLRARLRR